MKKPGIYTWLERKTKDNAMELTLSLKAKHTFGTKNTLYLEFFLCISFLIVSTMIDVCKTGGSLWKWGKVSD